MNQAADAKKISAEDVLQNLEDDNCLVDLLRHCAKQRDVHKGSRLHAYVLKNGLYKRNILVMNSLVTMYAKSGALLQAQQLFDDLSVRNVVSFTTLIAGYAQHGHGKEALNYYIRMHQEALLPNSVTSTCTLRACSNVQALQKGKQIHAKIMKHEILERDVVLCTALVDMYARCGVVETAQGVFDGLSTHDVASWNAIITGYSQHACVDKALKCFQQMRCEGFTPDAITFVCVLKACGSLGAFEMGKRMHSEIMRKELLGINVILGNALVDMYAECGKLEEAQQTFDELPERNVISWNVLISAYLKHGYEHKALSIFERMRCEGLSPEAVTFLSILKACGCIGAAQKGREIHENILLEGLLEKNNVLGTALVDMYAKCGALTKALEVFEELPFRNIISWTALIAGYAQGGEHDTVISLFRKMTGEGIQPNLVTFTVLLNACSFSGLVDEGKTYFEIMSTCYGISPTLQHHTCMIHLFSRMGHFDNAVALIQKMSSRNHLPTWYALLGSCKTWGNMNLGRVAFENTVRLNERSTKACANDSYLLIC